MAKFISLPDGSQVDYNAANSQVKAAADAGTYKISDGAMGPAPAPVQNTPVITRDPGLLAGAKAAAATTADTIASDRQAADLYAANQRQARIDAINTTFQPRIDTSIKEGEARTARVRAMNTNAGIIGSGVDAAKVDTQEGLNKKATQAIEDEKALQINDAFNIADKLSETKYQQLSADRKTAADTNVSKYQDLVNTATAAVKAFGAAGTTLDDIKKADPNTYKNLTEVGGLSDFQIVSMLNQANPKLNAKLEFKDGTVFQYYIDPKTNQVNITSQTAPNIPKDYKPQIAPDGTLLFYPDKIDPNKPISEQILTGGNYAKPKSTSTTDFKLSQGQKSKLIGLGFDSKAADSLESYLSTGGTLDDAFNAMSNGGKPLTDAQKNQFKAVISGTDSGA